MVILQADPENQFRSVKNVAPPEVPIHGKHDISSTTQSGSADGYPGDDKLEPIAIIGMGIKFPGDASSVDSFWEMLLNKECASEEFPRDRMNIDVFYSKDQKRKNKIVTRRAHFLKEDILNFDAAFFKFLPVEAGALDPQQRSLLETTYQALENAGLSLDEVNGSNTSVHVGCFTPDFTNLQWEDPDSIPKYSITGAAGSMLSNRLSWFYNLLGASMTVDTACSSSMIALDLACEGLWAGHSRMAVVAGANLLLTPEMNIAMSNMNFLSPDGRCYSFDRRANGYGRGEGFATLILKPVSHAIEDGDTIRAVIRSVGINQDGYTPGGIMQPSEQMQSRLIRETYMKANLDMNTTRFFEAHGTGTLVGDPVEAAAIGQCFRKGKSESQPMYVGAVKSNIGHLEGCSGLAGVVKAVLVLEKGIIPPNANFDDLNPNIDAEFLHLKFPTESIPWPTGGLRRASVNSFGFGGANGHVVLEDAYNFLRLRSLDGKHTTVADSSTGVQKIDPNNLTPKLVETNEIKHPAKSIFPQLLSLSAADQLSLDRLIEAYCGHFNRTSNATGSTDLSDLAYTMNSRRTVMSWRSFAVIDNVSSLQNFRQLMSKPIHAAVTKQKLGFIFTGQGAQWYAMGRELLSIASFADSLFETNMVLASLGCKWSIIEELLRDKVDTLIHEPSKSQPTCTAIQIAIVDLLRHIGVRPSTVVGHSSGEIAAAYCAGYLSHASAITAAYHRGVLASELQEGGTENYTMAAVGVSETHLIKLVTEIQNSEPSFAAQDITVSCVNSPKSVTVSGPVSTINILIENLDSQKIFARKLKVSVGYHSPQMAIIADEYRQRLKNLQPGKSRENIVMMSSVTSEVVSADTICTSEYWIQNMVSPVNFYGALKAIHSRPSQSDIVKKLDGSHLREQSVNGWMEIGPHSALQGPLRDILGHFNQIGNVVYTSALIRERSASATILGALGFLHCHNFPVCLSNVGALAETKSPKSLTTLPSYPFNHSTVFWEESQRNRDFRFRPYGPHPLLGSPVRDWNPLEPQWSFKIAGTELPWIQDHKIGGTLLYPAAGMLIMAIEAVKLLSGDRSPIGYEIMHAQFISALVVSMTKPTETQLNLSSMSGSTNQYGTRYKGWLYARKSDDLWEEVFTCEVRADYGRAASEIDKVTETDKQLEQLRTLHQQCKNSCDSKINNAQLYQEFGQGVDMFYGPPFQSLEDVAFNLDQMAYAKMKPNTWLDDETDAAHDSMTQVIHPTSLDGLFHLMFVGMTCGFSGPVQTTVPFRVGKLWLSALGAGKDLDDICRAVSTTKSYSRSMAICDLSVLSQDRELRVLFEDTELKTVSRAGDPTPPDGPKPICHFQHYDIDLDTMTREEIVEHCESQRTHEGGLLESERDVELMTLCYSAQAIKELEDTGQTILSEHETYAAELKRQIHIHLARYPEEQRKQRKSFLLDPLTKSFLQKKTAWTKRGELWAKVGDNLTSTLLGNVDPLQLLFEDRELLGGFYDEETNHSQMFDVAGRYLEALVHKQPNLKFIEVGAGTGATTKAILKILERVADIPRYEQYMFTDISPSFFESAKAILKRHERLRYRALDIEKNPAEQGFDSNYDIVIAASVLHATKNLDETIQNTRRLLKPGGKLIMMELTVTDVNRTGFAFGLLPGWWLSDDFRKDIARGPYASESQWDQILKRNGFSGTDMIFRDFKDEECHIWSVMVATAVDAAPKADLQLNHNYMQDLVQTTPEITTATLKSRTVILYEKASILQCYLAAELRVHLNVLTQTLEDMEFHDACLDGNIGAKNYIVLYEVDQFVLHSLEEAFFKAVKRLLTSARSVVWVTGVGERAQTCTHSPSQAVIRGMCRSSMFENHKVSLVTLALERRPDMESFQRIARVFNLTMSRLANNEQFEPEYIEINGHLSISRIAQNSKLNYHIYERTAQPTLRRGFRSGPPLKLHVQNLGLLDSLVFVEDEQPLLTLMPDEVEIDVQAAGLNFRDCLSALGRLNEDMMGFECAGVVSRIGTGITDLHVGDRVCGLTKNAFRRFVRARAGQMVRIPECLTFTEATSIPVCFLTAFYSLHHVARLQEGESILIHAAAGGTGQATIQLAKLIGAEVYATVGSKKKKELLMTQFGIPEDHIFYSRDTSFADGVRRMTQDRGVDVVLNSLAGDALIASWNCVATFGRFVEIGRKDIDSHSSLPMNPFAEPKSFASVEIEHLLRAKVDTIHIMLTQIVELFEQGLVYLALPLQSYDISEMKPALRYLQSGQSSGKIVIDASKDVMVEAVAAKDSNYRLDANSTFVIAGGLGGIGRSMARWLARRGARYLVLLSRSGPDRNSKAQELIAELVTHGVQVKCPLCDISDSTSLDAALRTVTEDFPPIKGCIQASMVLRDAVLAHMSYDEWQQSTRPKIQGSWNLHNALPKGMHFFILLSSICGVFGNGGQANYAAGNAYEDDLAGYRVAQGEKAVALDLGLVLGEGVVAENAHLMNNLVRLGFLLPISQDEILAMLDYYCNPALEIEDLAHSQIVTGLELPANTVARGQDVALTMRRPLYRYMHQLSGHQEQQQDKSSTNHNSDHTSQGYRAAFINAASNEDAVRVVVEAFQVKLSRLLGIPLESITSDSRIDSYGVDSLIAIELRNWLSREWGAEIAVFEILGGATLINIGASVTGRSLLR